MKHNKAFIFDMDGVLIDSERAWIPYQEEFSTKLFGKEIYHKIGSTIGISIDQIYQKAVTNGFTLDKQRYYEIYDKQAELIYKEAKPTANIDQLITYLKRKNFKLGLVSSSRIKWIDIVLEKLTIKNYFDYVVSLNERSDLKGKPYPDGYLYAMHKLNASSSTTIILEDSNTGIQSAKASKAFTIGFTEHLVPNYRQLRADTHAGDLLEVIEIIEEFTEKSTL